MNYHEEEQKEIIATLQKDFDTYGYDSNLIS